MDIPRVIKSFFQGEGHGNLKSNHIFLAGKVSEKSQDWSHLSVGESGMEISRLIIILTEISTNLLR